MLRALRRSTFAPTLRRLMALLLGVCVSVAFAEPMIADSCDEDAQQSQRAGSTLAASERMAPSVMMALDTQPTSAPGPDAPEHAVHLCHCAHAHGSTLAGRHSLAERLQIVASVLAGQSDRLPPSVVEEPQLRPPRQVSAA